MRSLTDASSVEALAGSGQLHGRRVQSVETRAAPCARAQEASGFSSLFGQACHATASGAAATPTRKRNPPPVEAHAISSNTADV